jgi:hypothetical protein
VKTTIYLNQPSEERYKKIKAINPSYSLSEAAEEGLKLEEVKLDTQLTGMEEQIATKGTHLRGDFYGTKAKFIGIKLAHERTGEVGPDRYEYQTLYLTKKGKYLLQISTEDARDGEIVQDYKVCNSIAELQKVASPVLLTKAGTTEGELLPDLDI